MRCLIAQPIHPDGLALLARAGIEPVQAIAHDAASLAAQIAGCDAVITRDAGFPAAAFAGANRLRAIVVHGVGYDAVDVETATARGVVVANTPGVNARSVAEHALGLTLALARGTVAADRAERAGTPGFRESRAFTELADKTALIVGWGATGRAFGTLLNGLGVAIIVHSPHVTDIGPYIRAASLEAGLAGADVVSLHTPMRAGAGPLMTAGRLAGMRAGALLVNVARAGLIDEAALDAALSEGRIAGVALDVYTPSAPRGPLARHPNVIFTPHLGATTQEALSRVARAAAAHVVTALSGGLPNTTLNPHLRKATP